MTYQAMAMNPIFMIGVYMMIGAAFFHLKTVIHPEEDESLRELTDGEPPERLLAIYLLAYAIWPYIMGLLVCHYVRIFVINCLIFKKEARARKLRERIIRAKARNNMLKEELKRERTNNRLDEDDPQQRKE